MVRTRERFTGIGQFLTMPIFFASNAIYPIELMPRWLQIIARFNPLTYEVDGLRYLMITGSHARMPLLFDYAVPRVPLAILIAIATRIYPGLAE